MIRHQKDAKRRITKIVGGYAEFAEKKEVEGEG
jgi:hypothetical protein